RRRRSRLGGARRAAQPPTAEGGVRGRRAVGEEGFHGQLHGRRGAGGGGWWRMNKRMKATAMYGVRRAAVAAADEFLAFAEHFWCPKRADGRCFAPCRPVNASEWEARLLVISEERFRSLWLSPQGSRLGTMLMLLNLSGDLGTPDSAFETILRALYQRIGPTLYQRIGPSVPTIFDLLRAAARDVGASPA